MSYYDITKMKIIIIIIILKLKLLSYPLIFIEQTT